MAVGMANAWWVFGAAAPTWSFGQIGVVQKIDSFATLAKGWRYGDGGPIPQKTIKLAISLVAQIQHFGIWDIDAFAGGGGEISLVATIGGYDLEVIVEDDGTISVAYDINGKQISYKPRLVHREANKEISAIVGKAWSTSGYFTHETSILKESGLIVWHSAILGEVFPLSTPIAYVPQEQVSQNTLGGTMISLPVSHQRSGSSTPQYSLNRIA